MCIINCFDAARGKTRDHRDEGQSQGHTGDPEAEHGGFSGSPVLPGNRIGITRSSMLGMTKTCCKDK